MDRKMVKFIQEQYPPGTRIRLNSMNDPYAPVTPGTNVINLSPSFQSVKKRA